MSLPHILLGMLKTPQSGYDLKKEFSESLQHFWHAQLSQIYPTLKQLEKKGLIKGRVGETRAGPQRREYRRTEKGRQVLLKWLESGPVTGTERVGYLAQVFFLAEVENEAEVIAYLNSLRAHMAHWLDALRKAETAWREAEPGYPDQLEDADFFAQLTLSMGLRKVQANLDWCDEAIARVRARSRATPFTSSR